MNAGTVSEPSPRLHTYDLSSGGGELQAGRAEEDQGGESQAAGRQAARGRPEKDCRKF